MSWFGPMKPARIVKKAYDGLTGFSTADESKKSEFIAIINKNFGRMTEILYKKKEGEEASSRALQLVTEISHTDFIMLGLRTLIHLPVEQRKQFTIIFTGSIAHQTGSEYPIAIYVQRNPEALDILLHFYDHPELAVSAGEMLRLCAHHQSLAKQLLAQNRLDILFSYFAVPHFDVSADSFATFRELVLYSPQSEEFLSSNIKYIVDKLHSTLDPNNYAACRQTLKLIGEIIVQSASFQDSYLTEEKNLIQMMKLMASTYKNISMEAFHVFKLFVAKEEKPEPVIRILKANSQRLIDFIKDLLEGIEDSELQREKEFLIVELSGL